MQTEKVMKAYELFDNAPRKRYEFRIDGLTPMIEYAKPADGVIVLTHTEVPRELAGRGIGSRLVEKALADIDRQGLRLIPPVLVRGRVHSEESSVGTDRRAGVTAGRRICLLMDEFERSWK